MQIGVSHDQVWELWNELHLSYTYHLYFKTMLILRDSGFIANGVNLVEDYFRDLERLDKNKLNKIYNKLMIIKGNAISRY